MMVLRVRFEMLGQVVDAFAENGDLNFGGPGVGVVCLVGANQFGLAVFGQRHAAYLHERPRTPCPRVHGSGPGTGTRRIARKSLTRTSSTSYIRTTDGCKASVASIGWAMPSSWPRES